MPASFLPTTQRAVTTTLTDIGPQGAATVHTPVSKVRTAWVRFANVGAVDATADLYIVDTQVAANANDGYRAKNFPVPYNNANSAPDFEQKLVLTYGQKLQHRASANSVVAISVEWVEDDA